MRLLRARPGAPGLRRLDLDASSVRQALLQSDPAGVSLRPDGSTLALGVVAFRNGQDLRYAGGLDADLAPGDCLLVVTPVTDS